MPCGRCGSKGKRSLIVLSDYGEKGGWIERTVLCRKCADEVAAFMLQRME
jgi:hypothetical protein